MVNAQNWLNQNYPPSERSSIKKMDISNQDLVGPLKLEGFSNLENFDCSHNHLISLNLKDNNNLKEINCSHNNLAGLALGNNLALTDLDCSFNNLLNIEFITTLQCPKKLLYLDLRNNRFLPSNLSVFSPFSQIKKLYLGTSDLARIRLLIYNQFYGSLKPLQNCQDLERLCISNTAVNYGFEYLSDSLKEIFIADMREKLTGEDLGHIQILTELVLFDGDFNQWRNSKILGSEKLPQLIKERDAFQKLTSFWKEKFENSQVYQVNNLGKEFNVALKILQGGTGKQENNSQNFQKEIEKKDQEIATLKKVLVDAEKNLEDLRVENENYKIVNSLIKEKYERIMAENPQLRRKQLESLLTEPTEEYQTQIQINPQKNIYKPSSLITKHE